jgi:antitoxin component YwqK of YwqJK toxin-antitoxin module
MKHLFTLILSLSFFVSCQTKDDKSQSNFLEIKDTEGNTIQTVELVNQEDLDSIVVNYNHKNFQRIELYYSKGSLVRELGYTDQEHLDFESIYKLDQLIFNRSFDEQGNKKREITRTEEGIQQMVTFHPNGVIDFIMFDDGKKSQGPFVSFYDNGYPFVFLDEVNQSYLEYYESNGLVKLEKEFDNNGGSTNTHYDVNREKTRIVVLDRDSNILDDKKIKN